MNPVGEQRASASSSTQVPPPSGDESSNSAGNAMGLEDVRKLVQTLGIDASDDEVESMFRESDADGGGSIDDVEFSELVKRLQAKAGKSIAGKIRWRKIIQFVVRSLQSEKQKKSAKTAKLIEDIRKISEQKASIDLSGQKLVRFPDAICEYKGIKKLWLHENKISRISSRIGEFQDLTMLRLYSNRITRLPAAIGLLVNLQVLWVFDNRIVTIAPEIGMLTSLTNMSIDRNPVVKLPIQLGACRAISKFEFSPETIMFPPTEILLGGEKSIFDFLGRLNEASSTKSLVFASYGLKSLPADMLECTSLTELLLYGNDIQRLPPRLALLTELTSFKIDEPTLRFPPQEVSRVSHEKIFEFLRLFQDAVRSLKLKIPRFQLLSAPAECFDTWNLRCLDLSQNVISTIPDAISKLSRLHSLDVSHNKIAFFAESLGFVTTLTSLLCNDNSLVQMPNELFEGLLILSQLHMQNNCLSKLPSSISCLISLREFRLENNNLKSLPHGLTCLENLQELNLQDNLLTVVPVDLGACKRLAFLNVFQNHDLKSPPFEIAMCCNNPILLKGDSDEEDDVCDTDDETNVAKRSANRSFAGQPRWKSDPPYQKPAPLIRYLWGLYDALNGTSLQCAGTGLLSVPSVFLELLHLKSINVSFNRLHKLPASFTLLSQLQVINVSHNMFASLDSVFAGMLQITHVNVSYNFLETLPKEFGACEALEELECSGNPLALPSEEIFKIGPQAVVLYLRQVNIALHTYVLTLSNRHLEVFPEQLAEFDFIRTLDFSHNDIRRLPGALGTMTQLTRLDFSHNNLMSFPLGLDGLSNLISLNLKYNSLKELPVTFSSMQALISLDVSCNVLLSLPETLGCMSSLECLDCSRNELRNLPASLSSLVKLKEMNVSYNQIIHTPLGLSCLTSLQSCSFKQNKLLVLPSGLGVLPGLKDLQWGENPYLCPMRQAADEFTCEKILLMLRRLAAASRDSQKQLIWDNFGFRDFPDYDTDIFTFNTTGWFVRGLKSLNLEHNKIISFPDSFSRLSALTILDISYNGTVHLPNSMSCLTSLNTLKMRDCRCVALPAGLGLSKKLMRINCSGFDTLSPPAEVRRKHAQVSARYLRGVFHARFTDCLDWSVTEIMTLRALPFALAKNEYLPCNILTLLLQNNGLTELTSIVISTCIRVQHIDISTNFISELPSCLGDLKHLESLDVSSNCLSRIHDALGQLSSLKSLIIDKNLHMNDPPLDVSDTILFVQRVNQSKITHILDFSCMKLRDIPISIVVFAGSITDLNLSGNQISVVPASFAQLICVVSLDLSSNNIHTLSVGIALPSLEYLDISKNGLSILPAELCLCSSLKTLKLNENPWQSPSSKLLECPTQTILTYLAAFFDARETCELWLRDLPVCRFPMESLFLANITKLVALNCEIAEIPQSCFRLSRVQTLDLSRNAFEGTLNIGLCHLKGLVRCNLSHNNIRVLPMCLGFAAFLQHLDVSHNNLYTLPPSLCLCRDLSTVDVRHNFITRLPARMGLCARVVSLLCDPGPDNLYISPANPVPNQSTDQIIRYLLEVFNSWTSGYLNLEGFSLTFVPYDVLSFIGIEHRQPFPKTEPCPHFPTRFIETLLEESKIQQQSISQLESDAISWENEGPSVPLRGVVLSGNSIVELPDSFGDLSGISGDLNLSDNCLMSIPKTIGNLIHVTNLNLSGNSLTSIPDELSKLTAMTSLSIDSNAIEVLPVCIVTLSRLIKLTFSSNSIVYIPWQIGYRAPLFEEFEYASNPLRFPHPSIQNLGWKHVLNYLHRGTCCVTNNFLDFSGLPLTSFDHQMDHLTSATNLCLNDCAVTSFQDHFTLLTRLSSLSGQRMKVQTLHKDIGTFKALNNIKFICCPLTKGIPVSLAECNLMHTMSFRNCCLSELDDDLFMSMLNLRSLDVSGNFLTCMPSTLKQCTSLTSLCISSNLLSSVCKGTSCWSQLTAIDLSHNCIEHLPRGLGGLFHTCKLKRVNIANNPVKMPPPFIMSQGLEICLKYLFRLWRSKISNGLDLEHFKVSSIGAEMISLAFLEQLHLENNMLTLLPGTISRLTCLKELILSHNKLNELPNELFTMKSMTSLILDDNRIARISPRIGQMDNLEVLNIENNPVNTLPLDICMCRSMQVLQISIPNLQADYRDLLRESCDVLFQYLSSFKAFRNSKRIILPHKPGIPWPPLKVFPAQAFLSVLGVTEMILDDNELSKIPGSIVLLSCLTSLSVARNLLSQITPALCEIMHLKNLNITENERTLEDPPPSLSSLGTDGTKKVLSYLSSLSVAAKEKIFDISNFQLRECNPSEPYCVAFALAVVTMVAGFRWTCEIQASSISHNNLALFPMGLCLCTCLTVLTLSDNMFSRLPDEFESLTRLKTLDASKNRFDIIPDVIFRLSGLETLCFSQNQLFEWPTNLKFLTALSYLDLSGNNLQNYISDQYGSDHGDMVPEDALCTLSQLTHLDLCDCGLMALPVLSCLMRLDTVLAHRNHLTTVPSLPSSVRKIDAAFNLFATIPQSIAEAKELTHLSLAGNRISGVVATPEASSLLSLDTLVSLNLGAMPTLVFPPKEVIDGGSSAVLQFLREMATPEEVQRDPDGPEAKAEYAAKAPIIIKVLTVMKLEHLADNFRHSNVFDDHLGQMSNSEFKALGFRTMSEAIDFKEKAYLQLK